jgi:hypothetical protein
MLRLTHTQVAQGPLLISDIDDGLPNKTAKRGVGHPDKYLRDGNHPGGPDKSTSRGSSALKQKCYVPRVKSGEVSIAGYIDLAETDRVLMSQARGVIRGLVAAGQLTVTSFPASDVAAPINLSARFNFPSAGDITISGSNLTSLAPDISSVVVTGSGAKTLTQAQIISDGGTVGASSIVVKATSIPGVAEQTSLVAVRADSQLAQSIPVAILPTLATAVLSGGNLTLTGTRMTSGAPLVTSVVIAGTGAVTLSASQITTGGGTVSATSIVIPVALIPGVVVTASNVVVQANGLSTTPAVAVS